MGGNSVCEAMTLERMLEEITKYGQTSIFQYDDDTWSCTIKLRIRNPGGQFEIKSGYNHLTASSAVEKAFSRMKETLKGIMTDLQRLEDLNESR